jgi:hypothetical protein
MTYQEINIWLFVIRQPGLIVFFFGFVLEVAAFQQRGGT